MEICVIIITRNRATALDKCLASITKQTIAPKQVLVVNNNSTDQTQFVITKYKRLLPIIAIRESRTGIPFARNTAKKFITGDVAAFLDDDCIASPHWLLSIQNCFHTYPTTAGVIGESFITNRNSVCALIEFAYNRRWVLRHINNPNTVNNILSGVVIDFKNAAFRRTFIKQFSFSTSAPFGDVGDEDAEIGMRMFQKNQHILYNPHMRVTHLYSSRVSRLLMRNFWGGYGDEQLYMRNGIDLSAIGSKQKTRTWISLCANIAKRLSFTQKIYFFSLIFIYPFASRIGKVTAKIAWKLSLPLHIPQR